MWWDSKKEYLKIVNSSNDDKVWGICREEETQSYMDLNFSRFEWYVTKKVSVCEMGS